MCPMCTTNRGTHKQKKVQMFASIRKYAYLCACKHWKIMQIDTMNESQMMILESFAGAKDEQELNALMDVLRNFYANRLEAEMQRLWDNGTLNQEKLDLLRDEHLRTPYRK